MVLAPQRLGAVPTMLWHRGDDGGNRQGSPGRTPISRKPSRREGRCDHRLYLWSRACADFFCARAPGAAATRPSLRPHLFRGQNVSSKARAHRAARTRTCIRTRILRGSTRAMPGLTAPAGHPHERGDMRDWPLRAVPDIACVFVLQAKPIWSIRAKPGPGRRPRLTPWSSAPAAASPARAATSAASAPAAAPATTSAATTSTATPPGDLLQIAFLQVAYILPVEEMEGREADIGHFFVAKNEALIRRGVLGLRYISSRRGRCGASCQ